MAYWNTGNADTVFEDGKIARIVEVRQATAPNRASNIQHPDLRIIDACNKIVTTGLIDVPVHWL